MPDGIFGWNVGIYTIVGVMGLIMLIPVLYVVCQCDFVRGMCNMAADTEKRQESHERQESRRRRADAVTYGSAV